jgi:predicted acyl esterase
VAGDENLTDEQLAANRCDFGGEIRAHGFDDEWHGVRTADWSKVTVPFLSAGNWGGQGLHPRGNIEAYLRAASRQKWLEMHGLEHWTHYYTDYGVRLQKEFFGRFLKGEDNGWERRPPVLLQVRHLDRFEERAEDDWPIPRTRWTRLYLDAGTGTLTGEPVAGSAAIEYEALGEGVTFGASPFDEETEITGPVAAGLFVSSSTSDADLFVVLRVFDPDGEEVTFQGAIDPHTPIAQGWLRASHRKIDPRISTEWRPYHPHDETEPLGPGEVHRLDVELVPTSIVVPAGYRLALTVRGKDYEWGGDTTGLRLSNFKNELKGCGPFLHDDPEDRPEEVFGGTVTLHTGAEHPAYVLLPVIPDA